MDRFASELSAQLPCSCTRWYDLGCKDADSLAHSWQGEVRWVNPPWSLLDEVARKLGEERRTGTIAAGFWAGRMLFQQLEALADEVGHPAWMQ
ncbi:hypothetical protein CYMTET_28015 [Cymbomonas tetramitiformis]|uniref:Uncharacterized protein n=1 Tax=Cymbomonas tetramitiformis TaxID=36881 RepID=A0AAE0FNM6_9CHLO|nr:hypothetical protein CYMTET_28015 [Cymbomonas tetramitiformis]